MPVFNGERFLAEAIESVLAQDTLEEWELLVVDDGSRDRSGTIARQYACRFPSHIHLLTSGRGVNLGTSAARNLAIQRAMAPVLAFLDADDVWLPHMLRCQLALLRRFSEAAMVYANAERTWDMSLPCASSRVCVGVNQLPPLLPPSVRPGLLATEEPLAWWLRDETLVPCTCTVLARTDRVRAAGGFIAAFDGLYDDQAFYARLMLAHPAAVSDTCVARYRMHYGSCCAQAWHNDTLRQSARASFERWLAAHREGVARPPTGMVAT